MKFCLRDTAGSPERARWLHLARSGRQSQRAIWFILPAHRASHIIILNSSPSLRFSLALDMMRRRQEVDHVYFVHPSTDTSVDMSTDSRPMYRSPYRSICRPIYRSRVGRYVDRDVSVDISTDVYRPSDGRHIDRLSADISVDIAADTRPIR